MVSVCMATYNGEKYIKEQIESILEDLSWDDELIISDDGSTDSTLKIIESINDNRIKLFLNEHPTTPQKRYNYISKNFENALYHSTGDYIFFSDQDDIWVKGKKEACLNALIQNDCVMHDGYIVDQNLNIISETMYYRDGKRVLSGYLRNFIKPNYMGCRMAIKKEVLSYCLPIPSKLVALHDMWIGLLCDILGNVEFIDFKGIYHRRHGFNASSTFDKSTNSLIKKIWIRLQLLGGIIPRIIKQRIMSSWVFNGRLLN